MEDYNWFADLLSTFRSVNDWVKAAIVLGFCGSWLGTVGLVLLWRRPKKTEPEVPKQDVPPPYESDVDLLGKEQPLIIESRGFAVGDRQHHQT